MNYSRKSRFSRDNLLFSNYELNDSLPDSNDSFFDDTGFFVKHKINDNLSTNLNKEKYEYQLAKLDLEKLERYREETLHDLQLKYNLTMRKLEEFQRSQEMEIRHEEFYASKRAAQIEQEALQRQTQIRNQHFQAEKELDQVNQQIHDIQEKMRESSKAHMARKIKLETAIADLKDQIRELDEKEEESMKNRAQISNERRELEKRLKYELMTNESVRARLVRAKADLKRLHNEVAEFHY
ncbi:hypothetical protein TRFO_03041 [Tritrichomonas foetus]|uniref:Uncharacterized protein n=1 Tax=Tritrichomonas foetus TaxID=1144522 RepID=A0A1J4KYH9_9EUKA|nr:hypothetical protein TRFO_03041 [Tritrichomonas foetus]|eukprot:OHT14764.1 hypothetical protein TRFO_03041 [Tritrichomonas foetus]